MTTPAPAVAHHGRSEVVVDVAAIRHNVATLKRAVGDAQMMTVVKADGYGHGIVESARAAREGGADWLGAAVMEEALALRAAGDTGPILTWLTVPGERYEPCLEAGVDVTAYTVAELDEIAMTAREIGVPARVQLKIDTGFSRGGSTLDLWPGLVEAAAAAEESGAIRVTGVWSHFACADEPKHPANDEQEQAFLAALETVEAVGIEPEVVHLANSAAALLRPSARFDLVRCGIASYGLTPAPAEASSDDLGLVPAMTVRGRLALVKRVRAGSGVSYGHTHVTERETTIGVVPMGYGDGIPRHASSRAEVLVAARRRAVLGRVCMDQLVVDLGDDDVATGDELVLLGDGRDGGPTAQDWADAAGTISYEIVTRMGARQPGRMPRVHVDSDRTDNDREDTA